MTGEHKTLPRSEVISVLASQKLEFEVLESSARVLRLRVPDPRLVADVLAERAGRVKLVIKELLYLREVTRGGLVNALSRVDFGFLRGKRFFVRVRRVGDRACPLSSPEVEALVGEWAVRECPSCRVDFDKADLVLAGILEGRSLSLGVLLAESRRGALLARGTKSRPFVLPCALDVLTARSMVNLAKVPAGGLVLDPFAGTGGILIEAGALGYEAIGVEVVRDIARGCRENLRAILGASAPWDLVQADSLLPPFREEVADAVVTDPPYGRSSKTLGREPLGIICSFIEKSRELLKKGGRLVVLYPSQCSRAVLRKLEECGFRVEEIHAVRVHGGLTRELVVAVREE